MNDKDNLYDVVIRFNFLDESSAEELYLQDMPKEVWNALMDRMRDKSLYLGVIPVSKAETIERLLVQKSSIISVALLIKDD